ncbi:hypothetical protein BCR43DRAFT_528475 [Syncephalastrum racemosum]|uniref:Ran GTPase activator n=1 Tax=Syncephalastrum racemosum TaxID=13706 RepID=A0A1X2HRP9_SYNRA|nr:hypothetical protein BCR43DRAFT_528475 [Syncephalastrum racemosum]
MDDLTTICLSGNTLGVEASQALAGALKTRKSLKRALLSDIFTGRLVSEIPDALQALCDALAETSLTELDLSDNAFGPRSAHPLVGLLTETTTLTTLRLNNNGFGPSGGLMIAEALQKMKAPLDTIVCGRNRLEDGSSPAFADAFAHHKDSLRVVRMPQNGIRPDGIKALMRGGLRHCTRLEHLDLQDNTFTNKGSKALVAALPAWKSIVELNLSDCLLSGRGGLALAQALHKTRYPIARLRLQYNEICGDAALVLADAITAHMDALVLLELNGNRFGEDEREAQAIRAALAQWGHDEALDELDDMEEIDSDEEEEEEEEEDESDEEDELVKKADEAEAQEPKTNAATEEKDLVAQLEKTHI